MTHLARITRDWSGYAGEPVEIDPAVVGQPIAGAVITAFGTELACLRLHYRLRVGRVEFSPNLNRWYYVNR